MSVRISRAVLSQILAEAAATPEREVCGLLLGAGDCISECRHADNVAADPARYFELDPVVLLAAHREARRGGPQVLGHYHSHPKGRAEPSPTDAKMAVNDCALWMIVAQKDYGFWRAGADGLHGRYRRETVEIIDDI